MKTTIFIFAIIMTNIAFAQTAKKYDYVGGYTEDLAIVKADGKYGFIDRDGKEVIPLKY